MSQYSTVSTAGPTRCGACRQPLAGDADRCGLCGTPVPVPGPGSGPDAPTATEDPYNWTTTDEVRRLTDRVRENAVAMAAIGGVAAFLTLFAGAAAAAALLVDRFKAAVLGSLASEGGEAASFADFADSVLGGIRPAIRTYLFFGANWVPLRFSFSGSEGIDSIQLAGTVKLPLVAGGVLVAVVLFWAGRLTARLTPSTHSQTDALLQGAIVGAVYLLLLLATNLVQPRLQAGFEGAEATLTLSPSAAWTLVLGSLWALFAVAGALSAVGASLTSVLCRAAPRAAALVVGLRASVTAWAFAVPVAVLGVAIAGGVSAARHGELTWLVDAFDDWRRGSAPATGEVGRFGTGVGLILAYVANLAVLTLLRGIGPHLGLHAGQEVTWIDVPLDLQIPGVVAVVVSGLLAGALVRRRLGHHMGLLFVAGTIGLPWALTAALGAAVLTPEVTVGARGQLGVGVPLPLLFGAALAEGTLLALAGAELTRALPLRLRRVTGLGFFFQGDDAMAAQPTGFTPFVTWATRNRLAGPVIAVVLVMSSTAVAAVPLLHARLQERSSPRQAVLRYFDDLARGDPAAVLRDVQLPAPAGGGYDLDLATGDQLREAVRAGPDGPIHTGRVHVDELQVQDRTATAKVTITTPAGLLMPQTLSLVRATDRRQNLLYPVWVVVLPTTSLTITTPGPGGPVSLDGHGVGGQPGATIIRARVFSGRHRVEMQATDLLEAETKISDTTDPTAFVELQGMIRGEILTRAESQITRWLERCAAQTGRAPAGCPQEAPSYLLGDFQESFRWSLDEPPAVELGLGGDGVIVADAEWSMSYRYDYGYDFGPLYDFGADTELDSDRGQVSGTATFTVSNDGRRVELERSTSG